MNTFYLTFTQKNIQLKNCYQIIQARDEQEARLEAFKVYGNMCAFTYTPEQFRGQVELYNLTLIPITLFAIPNRDN